MEAYLVLSGNANIAELRTGAGQTVTAWSSTKMRCVVHQIRTCHPHDQLGHEVAVPVIGLSMTGGAITVIEMEIVIVIVIVFETGISMTDEITTEEADE